MPPAPPSFEPTQNSQQQRWVKLAVYLGFILIVVWLYASQPAPPRAPEKHAPPTSTAGDTPSPQTAKNDRNSAPAALPRVRDPAGRTDNDSAASDGPAKSGPDRHAGAIVHNARVTDEDGRVIYRGDVDLQPTLDRIERGKRLRFSHDGIVFENRERRLPQKPSGYYHEFVHPTPGDDGPGGQRVVLGRAGEVYYTPDHYHTFRRVP